MPKYVREGGNPFVPISIAALLLIAIAIVAPEALAYIGGITILIIAWSYIEAPKIDRFYANLYNTRRNLSICDFSKEFDCRVVDTWVIRAVYEQVQECIPYEKPIPIKGSDNLKEDLQLDDDDIDLDLTEEISQRTGRTMDNCESNEYYGKVHTVRDLVLFFNSQKQRDAT